MIRPRARWLSLIHLGHKTFCSFLELRYVALSLCFKIFFPFFTVTLHVFFPEQLVNIFFLNLFFVFAMQMRNFAKNNESPPEGFMCPGGWQVLVDYYQGLQKKESA
jgi:hypothetical protein